MNDYCFREARMTDLPAIEKILKEAVRLMLAEGKRQWDENYPRAEHVIADIRNHNGYVIEADGNVVSYGAVVFTGEPAYNDLQGEWLSDIPYVVVHRLAVAQSCQRLGIAERFFYYTEQLAVEKGIGSFRVDTNFDNTRMLSLFEKLGFSYCGKISYQQGERLAYEKILFPNCK